MLKPHVTLRIALTLLAVSGRLAAQIRTVDLSDRAVELFGKAASKPVVLVFVRTDCPISNRYAPEIQRLYRAYRERFEFYLVYPDRQESREAIQKHVQEYNYTVLVLRDPDHALTKLAHATVTPEAAIFSARGQLLYHGRVDNRYISLSKAMNRATEADMENALQAILAGRSVKVSVTRAIGCSLADAQ
jgi:thiol-disulfide isomerase/thioredoxin